MFEDISVRERKIWVELIIDVVVSVYYFMIIYELATKDGLDLAVIGALTLKTVIVSIVLGILLAIFFIGNRKEEPADERDQLIAAKANAAGYYTLGTGIAFLIFHSIAVAIGQASPVFLQNPLTPVELALTLGALVVIASSIKASMMLYYYRRGM